jgi:hypothetical protein
MVLPDTESVPGVPSKICIVLIMPAGIWRHRTKARKPTRLGVILPGWFWRRGLPIGRAGDVAYARQGWTPPPLVIEGETRQRFMHDN